MKRTVAFAFLPLLLLLPCAVVSAQQQGLAPRITLTQPLKPATARPPGPPGPRGHGPRMGGPDDDPDLAAALQSTEAKPSPERELALAVVQQLLGEGGIRRQPTDVLRAMLEQRNNPSKLTLPAPMPAAPMPKPDAPMPESPAEPGEESEPSPPSPLTLRVMTGDWSEIKDFLGALPKEVGPDVYGGLLGFLASDFSGVVLPQELLALSSAAPGAMSDKDLALLGKVVARSQHQAARPTEFLAAMKKGTAQLGGSDPATRIAAVKLLLAAGLVDEAAPYLPPLAVAREIKDAATLNLHARFLYQGYRQKQEQPLLLQAWELTQTVLNLPPPQELQAICVRRSLTMAPQVPREIAGQWFQQVFKAEPAAGLTLLAEVTEQVAQSFTSGDNELRERALLVQQLAGNELLGSHGEKLGDWSLALEMLTRGWINEAQKTAGQPLRKILHERDDRVEPLDMRPLLASAPSAAWQQAIGRDTADHVRHLLGKLAAQSADQKTALAIMAELAPRDPQLAKQLAEELVGAVTGGGVDSSDNDDMYWRVAHLPSGQRARYLRQFRSQRRNQRHEVTRAGQLRKLNELNQLLTTIKAQGIPHLSEDVVVEAFSSCHSPAEVYLVADIETIFGPIAEVPPDAALKLAGSMRTGLAQTWRNPDTQRQHGTKRTPQEQAAEVVRGYALALNLMQQATERAPERADLLALRGGLHFDLAEFLYGQQVELPIYVKERDAAFADFAQAAAAYDRALATLPAEQYSIEIFRSWFQAALGASDLAYLTRQDEPDKTQVRKLSQALGALQQGAAKHQELFAQKIRESLDQVPPVLKPHLVRQALVVVGEHPAAAALKERLAVYDDLLKEVELRLVLDGNDQVGKGRPFGVFVSLAGTRAVLRENDAFSSLLISTSAMAAMRGMPDPENDARQRLENELREKLSPAFEIEAFAFHPPQTQPRATGREGWEALPIAYLVLRAKDAAIDRLPGTQFDLEFSDGEGQVRLPVQSQLVLLDARAEKPPVRPAREVKVKQLLDDRELAKGRLRLEVIATAKGVVPELNQLLQDPTQIAGFETKSQVEQSLSVSSLETGEHIDALTERRWLIELAPQATNPRDDFTFPQSADQAYAVTLQRYDDADIVDAGATAALRWPVTHTARRWLPYALGGALLVLIAALAVFVIRSRLPVQVASESYSRPAQLTPFSVIGLLRRIQTDARLQLSPTERRNLSSTISRLEGEFFRRGEANANVELEPIVDQWIQAARVG